MAAKALATTLATLVFWAALRIGAAWCQATAHGGSCAGQLHFFQEDEVPYWPTQVGFSWLKGKTRFRFADWDGDGFTDILTGEGANNESSDWIWLYKQLSNGSFSKQELVEVHELVKDVHQWSFEVVDWDGDKKLDLLLLTASYGDSYGNATVTLLSPSIFGDRNQSSESQQVIVNTMVRGVVLPLWAVDFDEDGDADLILGGGATYFERIAAAEVVERTGEENPMEVFKGEEIVQIADVDGDGRLELVAKEGRSLRYFRHAADGSFVEPVENPFAGIKLFFDFAQIQIVDWNLDGLPDLFLHLETDHGKSRYFKHVVYTDLVRDVQFDTYEDLDLSNAEISFVDWNGDEFQDLAVVNRHPGFPEYSYYHLYEVFQDSVREVVGVFENVSGWDKQFNRIEGLDNSVVFADWDSDGDLDMVMTSSLKVHYYEMVSGSFAAEKPQHPFSNITLTASYQKPIVVDFDNDGDLDLFLGDRYFEKLADGTLQAWPQEHSPLKSVMDLPDNSKYSYCWRFVDCDADGVLDLIRVRNSFNPLQACKHETGADGSHTLHCSDAFHCLGTDLAAVGEVGREDFGHLHSFDVDLVDGRLRFIASPRVGRKGVVLTAGFCLLNGACYEKGWCLPRQTHCSCKAGHELGDCSGCEPNFYSEPVKLGQLPNCEPCPGDGEVCYGRGRCFDDMAAKSVQQESTAASLTRGNGSCICSEVFFHGSDERGRNTCMEGSCPAGTEEKDGRCQSCPAGSFSQVGGICKQCSAGKFSSARSGKCSSCPPGSISTRGSSSCDACPAGAYEVDSKLCNECPAGYVSSSGGNCTKCQVGTYAPKRGSITCNPCPPGTYAGEGSVQCSVCPLGAISGPSSEACAPCHAGSFAQASLTCEPCPGGTFAPAGSSACRGCDLGQVSSPNSPACWSCEGFLIRATPDPTKQTCQAMLSDIVFSLLSWGVLACLCFGLLTGFFGSIPISDISAQGNKIVVTTSIPHGLLARKCPLATFTGTGVPNLESSSFAWTVEGLSLYQLTLRGDGAASNMPLDTSSGYMCLSFAQVFLSTGFCRCPSIWWSTLLLAAGAGTATYLHWPLRLLVCGLGLGTGCLAFALRRRQAERTPILKRRRQFLKEWRLALQRCDRGPDRAMTVGKLQEFLQFFDSFIKERSMYYVCSNIVKPLTEPYQISFVELVGPSKIQWFVSHYWGMALRHFNDAIRKHAQSYGAEWQSSAYWICTFSNSQWHVKDELGHGRWEDSSFYLALRSPECKGTAMVIDEEALPLQRIWCLFEVYQTICRKDSDHFEGLLLCTSTGVLQQGKAGADVAMAVAQTVAELDAENAAATCEEDRVMIHSLIKQMPGGFDSMNTFIRDTICNALEVSHEHYEATLKTLMRSLTSRGSPSAPLPTLLNAAARCAPESKADTTHAE